jgi:hypothetical protein
MNRLLALACLLPAPAQEVPPLDAADLPRLLAEFKPRKGESPWREIAWHTDVREARERAAAEGKPIVVFTAADGSPLSRT